MRDIKSFINETRNNSIDEGYLENIILKNLIELGDKDIVDDVHDIMGDELNTADILRMYDFLKSKFGKDIKKWRIDPTPDYETYITRCKKWAQGIVDKFKLGNKMSDIIAGIGYRINGL